MAASGNTAHGKGLNAETRVTALSVIGPTVGLVVNTVGGYSRGVVRGVATFAAARAWTLRVQGVNEMGGEESPKNWEGAIVQAATVSQARKWAAGSVPTVNVSSSLPEPGLPTVISDDYAVGRLGADHFLRLGYRTLVFYAPDRRAFAKMRHEGFVRRCTEASVSARLIQEEGQLREELTRLPRPAAVMGNNDRAALAVLDACRAARLRVPDDIAVLGVDDDDLVQSLAYPALSTVNTARDRVGFEAAAMLERLMRGEGPKDARVLVAPKGVVGRRSTDATAISDENVAEAARFIHAHAGRPIAVDDVAEAATVSRRQLERRFKAALGHSILDEITRCRIDRARQLLIDTDLTLEQVGFASGFASASYFSVVFRKETGSTPQRFREGYRGR